MPTAPPAPINAVAGDPGFDWSTGLIFVGLIVLLVILRWNFIDYRNVRWRNPLVMLAALVIGGELFGRTGLAIVIFGCIAGFVGYIVYRRRSGQKSSSAKTPQ